MAGTFTKEAYNNACAELACMAAKVRTHNQKQWLALEMDKLQEGRPIKHPLDYRPIVVGRPSDWYTYDSDKNCIRDVEGNPEINQSLWEAARHDANGAQPDGYCIGGSSAASICGIYPGHEYHADYAFRGALELAKTMRKEKAYFPETESDMSEIFTIGHTFENAVAVTAINQINKTYFGKYGVKGYLKNDNRMYMSGARDENGSLRFPHVIADLDRTIKVENPKTKEVVAKYGMEIKTTHHGGLKHKKWQVSKENPYGVPENYLVQAFLYMAVTGLSGFFLCVQEYSMRPSDLLVRYIPANLEIEERILTRIEEFVQKNVIEGIDPEQKEDEPIRFNAVMARYTRQKEQESPFCMPSTLLSSIEAIESLDKALAELEEKYESAKTLLLQKRAVYEGKLASVFRDEKSDKAVLSSGTKDYHITYRHKLGRCGYDMQRLAKENPTLYEKSKKESISIVKTGLSAADKQELRKYEIKNVKPEMELVVSATEKEVIEKEVV